MKKNFLLFTLLACLMTGVAMGQTWKTPLQAGNTNYFNNSLYSTFFISATQGWAVGSDGIIMTTTDGGSTWTAQTSGTTNWLRSVHFTSVTQGWAIGDGGIILTTTNGGSTWTAQTSGTANLLNFVYFTSATQGWAVGFGGTILNTTNGGSTWTAQTSGTTADLQSVYFTSATQGWAVSNAGIILTTTSGGTTWTAQTSAGTFSQLNSVYFTSATQGWAVGNSGTILTTNNGGTTWTAQTSGTTNDLRSVYFTSATQGWAVGFGGTILTTNNGGSTWTVQTSGTTNELRSVYFTSATQGWAVGFYGTILTTNNGGSIWTAQTSGTTAFLYSVYFTSATQGWAVGGRGIILTTNNGGSIWTAQTSGTTNDFWSVYFTSATQGWAVGENGTILTTNNGGSTWTAQTSGTTAFLNSVYFISATQGWAVGFGGVIRTTNNGGSTWTAQTSGTSNWLNSVYFTSATQGWVVGAGGTILTTTDGGATWTAQTSGITSSLNSVYFISATQGWAVGQNGTILTTNDGGSTWTAQTTGTTAFLNSVSFTSANQGWAAGSSGTILLYSSAASPEINLKGNGTNIANGETNYTNNDHRDFGAVSVASGSFTRTFTIENTGSGNLTIPANGITKSGTDQADFTIGGLTLPATILPNTSATFTVTFDPSANGTRTAAISIANDDADENPYTFAIQGTGGSPFITRWDLRIPGSSVNAGRTELNFILFSSGPVNYTWETVPAGMSGSGTLPSLTYADVLDLPADVVIDLTFIPTHIQRIQVRNSFDRLRLMDVRQWGDVAWTSMENMFSSCTNLNISATDVPNLSGVTNMSETFGTCTSLTGPTNIGTWNTAAVTDMRNIFNGASLFNQNIGAWNTANVTNMSSMFSGAAAFNQPIGTWNTAAVTDMSSMFTGAALFNQDLSGWTTSAVTNMSGMFDGAANFNQNIAYNPGTNKWNTAAVTNMRQMFQGARRFNQNIGNWNTAAVTTMYGMFRNTDDFNQDISAWNTAAVTDMTVMFRSAIAFNHDISTWNVSAVTGMSSMFLQAGSFNQSLGAWGTKFNANVDLSFMLPYCGMSVANYDATLTGFNAGTVTGRTLHADNLFYCASAADRANLVLATGSGGKGWTISGDAQTTSCLSAEINLKGNGNNIANGDNTPVITDHTDFGPASVTGGTVTRTFTIENTGAGALTLGTVTGATTDFSLTQPVLTTVPANGSTTFTVTFDPTAAGKRTTTISIANNDPDEAPYTFAIEGYGGRPFITTWKTNPSGGVVKTIEIPTTGPDYNYDVDWDNDGIFDEFGKTGNATHDYGAAGTYTVAIRGSFPRIFFDNDGSNNNKILSLVQWGDIDWKSMQRAFFACGNLEINASDTPDLNDVTDMSGMFTGIKAINQDVTGWDVSRVTNMSKLFSGVTTFNQNISGWQIGNVTDMSGMFAGTPFNQNISGWNVSKVTNMARMFFEATAFNQNISGWNVSKVTNMAGMFLGAAFNQSLAVWGTKFDANVDLSNMLDNCGMNVANYDATLIGFNQGTVTGRNLGAAGLRYCASATARANLVNSVANGGKGWTITGDAVSSTCVPEINLKGNSTDIANGDNSPVITDHTDFGPVSVPTGTVTRTFTIENNGSGDLILGANPVSRTGDADFSFTQPSLTTIPVGSSTTFTVTFDPTVAGKRSATLSIANNDPDEAPYTFAIEGYGGKPFITTWKTNNAGSSNSTSITIPTTGTGYNYDVDWNNDGIFDEFGKTGDATHNYGTVSTYTVAVRGNFPRIYFNNAGDKAKILSLTQWGDIAWTSMGSAFAGCSNLRIPATDVPNLAGVTDMSYMFERCTSFNEPLPVGFNTTNVTTMEGMFSGCSVYNQLLPSSFNTGNVTTMIDMFSGCSAYNQPLPSSFNTANVTNMGSMFANCQVYNQPLPSSFNTSKVTDMAWMFYLCHAYNQPLPSSFNTSNVTEMSRMFAECTAYNQPLPASFNTTKVTSMYQMFGSCSAYNQPFPVNFTTTNVTNMEGMFRGTTVFNQNISGWDVSKVTNMIQMFVSATAFNQNLGAWNIAAATDMIDMLKNSGLSRDNYDATLIGWNNGGYTNKNLGNASPLQYCAAQSARSNMITNKGWTIAGDTYAAGSCCVITISFTGPNPVCQGSPTTLLPNTGGTWISNDPAKATVTADGQVTTLLPGAVTFTFTTPQGCSAESPVLTIKATPTSALTASQVDVCPNTEVTLDAHCSIPNATVNWHPGAPTVTPDAATVPYIYKASCVADGCVGNESSVEVRTHRILVDMKDLDVGTLPLPIVRAVKDNMAPTNLINAPVFPRRWTFIAKGCNASESAVFTLSGPVNFSAIDNTGIYAMFGNDEGGFYSLDHPNYGNGGSFPNGTYTLRVDLRSQDGVGGPFPKNRVATGSLLATRTLQFTVISPSHGSQTGARLADSRQSIADSQVFAQVLPNPISQTMRLQINEAKGQNVNVSLVDVSGRTMMQRSFMPDTNQHQEEFEVSEIANGMYFLRVKTEQKQTVLKVIVTQ